MAKREVALTTTDNPYDPIDQFDNWYRFDSVEHDYNTSSYLDRIAHTSTSIGEKDYINDIETAIDEIVKFDLISWFYKDVHYKKVVKETN